MKQCLYLLKSSLFSIAFLFILARGVLAVEPIADWGEAENLTYEIASHNVVSEDFNLFVIGGATGDDNSNVLKSTQGNSGSLSEWISISNIPDTRYWSAEAKWSSTAYILGGAKYSGAQTIHNTVYSALLNSNGDVSSWTTQTPLPANRALGASVVVGDRIYFAGGFDNSGRHDDIYYASISANGDIGAWITSTISLPMALYGFSMLEHNGNIYVLGGSNAANITQEKVYKSTVSPDGSLTPWIELNNFPLTVYRGSAIVVDDKIISVGGEHGAGAFIDKVYYADILPGGIISEWVESANNLPIPVSSAALARIGDYLYLTGGTTNGYTYLDTVYYTKLDNSVNLNVPVLKQISSPWNDDVYDNANLWSSDQSFARWGCAVTSAAMVFDYHGLREMGSGAPLDPGALNAWLKSQPDGYVGNGNTNWLALSRLSRQISDLNGVDFDALEFSRSVSSNTQLVKDAIDSDIPSILRVPGHFIVGKGYTDDSIVINDPFYDRNDLSEYGNTFQNISRFIPSNTDLSYIMLTVNDSVEIKVFDGENNEIRNLIVEEPIVDPAGEATTSAQILKIIYIPKPTSGNYRIEVLSNGDAEYKLDAYLYDENGEVVQLGFEDVVSNGSDTYELKYNKEELEDSFLEKELIVTYDSLLQDIKRLYEEKKIKFSAYVALSAEIGITKRFENNNKTEKKLLKTLQKTVKSLTKAKQITPLAKNYLLEKIRILQENI